MQKCFVAAVALGVVPVTTAVACFDVSGSPSPPAPFDASHFGDVAHDSLVLDAPVLDDGATGDSAPDAATDARTSDAADARTSDATDAAALTYPQVVRADAPLSYWRFGEASGSVAKDEIGATNGTYTGAVTLGAAGAIAGDANTAAAFDGSTGYVSLGNGFGFNGVAAMSVEAWVKPGTLDNSYRRVFSKETTDGNGRQGYLMAAIASGGAGSFSFERFRDGQTEALRATLPTGQYSHVVSTYDGATMVLYVNGAAVTSVASARSLSSISVPLNVATYSDPQLSAQEYFPGAIDELAIYDHALTAARVLAHYRAGTGM